MNYKMIGKVLGQILAVEAAFMLPAMAICAGYSDWLGLGSFALSLAIIALLAGLAVLGGVHWYIAQENLMLAQRVLSTGLCILLFSVALLNWLSARRKK